MRYDSLLLPSPWIYRLRGFGGSDTWIFWDYVHTPVFFFDFLLLRFPLFSVGVGGVWPGHGGVFCVDCISFLTETQIYIEPRSKICP